MEEKIVIVTAYFSIESLKTHEFYLEKALPFLLKCKEHIILYTVAKYADIFRKIRGDLPLTLVIDSVDTDNLPISMPITQILDKEIWKDLASKLSNRHPKFLENTKATSFSVPLLQLWLSKPWFVSRTLERKEFDDFHVFLWQDIGSCRNELDQENLHRWPSLQKLKLRGFEDEKLILSPI